METIVIIAVIWGGLALFSKFSGGSEESNSQYDGNNTRSTIRNYQARPKISEKSKNVYRPKNKTSRSKSSIRFGQATNISSSINGNIDLTDLHDAFTGAALRPELGLYRCGSCTVFYHLESYNLLREENGSRCVSCQKPNIVLFDVTKETRTGKDYNPDIVTLDNYRDYEGSVVTFEGFVHKVNESRRGSDFAVMFENTSWVRGFKLVFFRDAVRKVGGPEYIRSLRGKTIKVRGLLINHKRFGYEIIISEDSMIVGVR